MSDDEMISKPAGEPFRARQDGQQSVIVDMWVVPAGHQQELVDGLLGLFEKLRLVEGFVDGRNLRKPRWDQGHVLLTAAFSHRSAACSEYGEHS